MATTHNAADPDVSPGVTKAATIAYKPFGLLFSVLGGALANVVATKGKRAGVGPGLAGAGGVVALFGVGTLVAAAVAALALVVPVWLAAVIVAVVLFVVAGVLALVGRSSLRRAVPLVPETALENLQSDITTVEEAVRR